MPYLLGVDLGTTFTAAAVGTGGEPTMVGLDDRTVSVPSVLFATGDGFLVGAEAEQRGLVEPGRVVRELKQRLGDRVPVQVAGSPYPADVLAAELLKWVVATVTDRRGEAPAALVLTHPASWGPFRLEALERVAVLADVGSPRWCVEPVAAAVQHAARSPVRTGDRLAVYSLGGGSFDVCVLEKTAEDFVMLGPPEGVEHLGGSDFDEALVQLVRRGAGGPPTEAEPQASAGLARLRRDCVVAKETLSRAVEVDIPVTLTGVSTTVRVTRSEFEALIRPALQQTVQALTRAIRSAGLTPAQLAGIILVGGSARIPLVAELLRREFEAPTALAAEPEHDIVLGAVRLVQDRGGAGGSSRPTPMPVVRPVPVWPPIRGVPIAAPAAAAAAIAAPAAAAAAVATTDLPAAAPPPVDVPAAAPEPPAPAPAPAPATVATPPAPLAAAVESPTDPVTADETVLTAPRSEWSGDATQPLAPLPVAPPPGPPTGPTPPPYGPLASPTTHPTPRRGPSPRVLVAAVLGLLAIAAGIAVGLGVARPDPDRNLTKGTGTPPVSGSPSATDQPLTVAPFPQSDPLSDTQLVVPVRVKGDDWDLYLADTGADGPGRQLTTTPAFDTFPSLSPDRRSVIYVRKPDDDDGHPTLRVVAADGQGDRGLFAELPPECARSISRPAWNPQDPTMLAAPCVDETGRVGLYELDTDGRVIREIDLDGNQAVGDPAFSPDGSRLVFWAAPDNTYDAGTLMSAPTDGSAPAAELVAATMPGQDADPVWSPDGSSVAFRRRAGTAEDRRDLDIWRVGVAPGSTPEQLTTSDASEQDPSWSPGGDQIAFKSARKSGGSGDRAPVRIWVMQSDGSDQRLLWTAGDPGEQTAAAWTAR